MITTQSSNTNNSRRRRSGVKDNVSHIQMIKENFIAPYRDIDLPEDESQIVLTQELANVGFENMKPKNKKDYIISLFPRKLFADLYFAWCKDCSENITPENAKYFRDELLMRKNKDFKNYNFHSMRIAKNFVIAFVGNIDNTQINKLDLSDNLITDICMHNLKNIISSKRCISLNLASNMISTEGLKIVQNEIINSESLLYLNVFCIKLVWCCGRKL
jgi:hypothetical protein